MTITIGGTSRELSEEQVKQAEAFIDSLVGAGPWKPKLRETYHYIGVSGAVEQFFFNNDSADGRIVAFGNCFQTKELAEAHAKRLCAFNNLWQLATAIGTSKEGEERWTSLWIRDEGKFAALPFAESVRRNDIEFPSQAKCERFIREGQVWLDVLYPLAK